jgi:hypothetical protein
MTDLKEQWICIKCCFELGKTAPETHKMLKEVFGDNALCQTNGVSVSRADGCQSLLDDLQTRTIPKYVAEI